MAIWTVSWEIYEELRTLDISDPSIPDPTIASRKFRLGQATSWARWGRSQQDRTQITARNEAEFHALAPLTTSVVLLGVNWGATLPDEEVQDWHNFHTAGHAGDARLSKSIPPALDALPHDSGQSAPAPYMTDVFKLVPTRNGVELQRQIAADAGVHDHVARCAELLRRELAICTRGNGGVPPLLVALGGHAYEWLTGKKRTSGPIADVVASVFGGDTPRIAKINHASASRPDAERTAQLITALHEHRQYLGN
ncbi:hypothetical protein [Corynebacterium sp.]|uniref:hypothetical protein n=1 Tax=Corynebacterium sp. TaxID=1720 RepID=UPI0026DD6CC7|nr:hypothetical protein [Corynebacterium sp.]MDO5031923.1 hypothetical protein [Corynebacterium sp.]